MNISYKNKKIEKEFNEEKRLIKNYGPKQTKRIQARQKAIRAAASLYDFWPPKSGPEKCHELAEGKRKKEFQLSMDLAQPYRLIFIPNHAPVPIKEDGGLDWERVTAVKILGVEDTHDNKN